MPPIADIAPKMLLRAQTAVWWGVLSAGFLALAFWLDNGVFQAEAYPLLYMPFVWLGVKFAKPGWVYGFAAVASLLSLAGLLGALPAEGLLWQKVFHCWVQLAVLWLMARLLNRSILEATRYEQSQGHLRAVVDHVVDGLITIDDKGRVESFNPACVRIFGYEVDEVLGKNVKMLMPEPYHSQHDGYIKRYHEEHVGKIIGTAGREVEARRKDGSVFPIDLSVSKFHFAGKIHFSGIVRDISSRKEAESAKEQLRQAQKMEALGQLTGGVAHDFNNLLAVVLGNLDLLSERLTPGDPSHRYIIPAVQAAMQGSELTSRLLSFGRKQSLRPKTLPLNDLVDYFSRWVKRVVDERISIELHLAENVWPVSVDANQLQNALLNLSVNARDAMPTGGRLFFETKNVTLDVHYVRNNPDAKVGDYVMLCVSDTGEGMPQSVVDKAFDPFFTTKVEGKGSGLGLSMVYGFVKQSEGHIKIYSEEGAGTSIKVYLPRSGGEVSAFQEAEEGESQPMGVSEDMHVLVVEDNPNVLQLTSSMVESFGFKVSAVDSGEKALEVLERHKDIVLLVSDVMLAGGLSGPQMAKIARGKNPSLKVLFNSGYAEEAMRQSGMLDEDVHLLGKPFRKQQLAEKIREILELDGAKGA